MKVRSCFFGLCACVLPWAGSVAAVYNDREILITEFVQDMGSLEDNRAGTPAAHKAADVLLDDALTRLGGLSAGNIKSLDSVIEAFAAHRKLATELALSAERTGQDNYIDQASLDDGVPRLRVRLENLTQNYLHVAQLVLSDTLGDPNHRLPISAETKQRVLEIVARYPVDKEDADGYLSALWFIREGMKRCKCEDEV